MFKRTRWMVVGYGLGATTSYLAARRLRRTAARYAPNEVASRVGATVGGTARHVQDAVAQGRDERVIKNTFAPNTFGFSDE